MSNYQLTDKQKKNAIKLMNLFLLWGTIIKMISF